jgi:K+ transporter
LNFVTVVLDFHTTILKTFKINIFVALQIGFSVVLLPSVLLAYIGQAAYLRIYPEHVADTFYKSIPGTNNN